ncbi:hypothetical protein Tco_0072661 [Tanacetum coccineum]
MAEHEAKRKKMFDEYNHQITHRADQLPIAKISYKVNSSKEASMRITRGNDPLNLTVYEKFILKTLRFSEWLEVHALASKSKGKSIDLLLKSLRAKFEWVLTQAKKLSIPPPHELSTFRISRNLIPPPGIEGSRDRVIMEPESGIFFYNEGYSRGRRNVQEIGADSRGQGLVECKASASNLRRIQVKEIVKEVEDHLKTYSSARMDISWLLNEQSFNELPSSVQPESKKKDSTITSTNGSQFNHNIPKKDKNPKPNPSSYPNHTPLKNKDKFPDLPSFAFVTNGIAKPIVDTSSTNANIRALVLDDQDLINVEDPSTMLLVKLKDVNSMSNMYVICMNEDNFQTNASLKSIYSCIKIATPSFKVNERMIWIEIRGLPLGAWRSNVHKKVADMFAKFMFLEAKESTEMSSGRICISTKSHNFVSERVLVKVHGVDYDVHMHELGTWNINFVNETLDSSNNIDVNGMEKVEDSGDKFF